MIYSGDDGTSMDFANAGGDGCISVTANIAPAEMHKMMMASFAGDEELAKAINAPLLGLHKDLFVEANPIPIKWAVARQGRIPSAMCRPPLDALDEKFHTAMEKLMKDAGLLEDVYMP